MAVDTTNLTPEEMDALAFASSPAAQKQIEQEIEARQNPPPPPVPEPTPEPTPEPSLPDLTGNVPQDIAKLQEAKATPLQVAEYMDTYGRSHDYSKETPENDYLKGVGIVPESGYYEIEGKRIPASVWDKASPQEQFSLMKRSGKIPQDAEIKVNKDGTWTYTTKEQKFQVPSDFTIGKAQLDYLKENEPEVYKAIINEGNIKAFEKYGDKIVETKVVEQFTPDEIVVYKNSGGGQAGVDAVNKNREEARKSFEEWKENLKNNSPMFYKVYQDAGGGEKGINAVNIKVDQLKADAERDKTAAQNEIDNYVKNNNIQFDLYSATENDIQSLIEKDVDPKILVASTYNPETGMFDENVTNKVNNAIAAINNEYEKYKEAKNKLEPYATKPVGYGVLKQDEVDFSKLDLKSLEEIPLNLSFEAIAKFQRDNPNDTETLKDYNFDQEFIGKINEYNNQLNKAVSVLDTIALKGNDMTDAEQMALNNALIKADMKPATSADVAVFREDVMTGDEIDSKKLTTKARLATFWNYLGKENKEKTALLYANDPYKDSYFASAVGTMELLQERDRSLLTTLSLAPHLPITHVIAKQMTMGEARELLGNQYKTELSAIKEYVKENGTVDINKLEQEFTYDTKKSKEILEATGYSDFKSLKENLEYYNNGVMVTGGEWGEAATVGAIDIMTLGGGSALASLGRVGRWASGAIWGGAAAYFAPATYKVVVSPQTTFGEKALAVVGEVGLLAGGVMALKAPKTIATTPSVLKEATTVKTAAPKVATLATKTIDNIIDAEVARLNNTSAAAHIVRGVKAIPGNVNIKVIELQNLAGELGSLDIGVAVRTAIKNIRVGANLGLDYLNTQIIRAQNVVNEVLATDLSAQAKNIYTTLKTELGKLRDTVNIEIIKAQNRVGEILSTDVSTPVVKGIKAINDDISTLIIRAQNLSGEILSKDISTPIVNKYIQIRDAFNTQIILAQNRIGEILATDISAEARIYLTKAQETLGKLRDDINTQIIKAQNTAGEILSTDISTPALKKLAQLNDEVNTAIIRAQNEVGRILATDISTPVKETFVKVNDALNYQIIRTQNLINEILATDISTPVAQKLSALRDEFNTLAIRAQNLSGEILSTDISTPVLQKLAALRDEINIAVIRAQNRLGEILSTEILSKKGFAVLENIKREFANEINLAEAESRIISRLKELKQLVKEGKLTETDAIKEIETLSQEHQNLLSQKVSLLSQVDINKLSSVERKLIGGIRSILINDNYNAILNRIASIKSASESKPLLAVDDIKTVQKLGELKKKLDKGEISEFEYTEQETLARLVDERNRLAKTQKRSTPEDIKLEQKLAELKRKLDTGEISDLEFTRQETLARLVDERQRLAKLSGKDIPEDIKYQEKLNELKRKRDSGELSDQEYTRDETLARIIEERRRQAEFENTVTPEDIKLRDSLTELKKKVDAGEISDLEYTKLETLARLINERQRLAKLVEKIPEDVALKNELVELKRKFEAGEISDVEYTARETLARLIDERKRLAKLRDIYLEDIKLDQKLAELKKKLDAGEISEQEFTRQETLARLIEKYKNEPTKTKSFEQMLADEIKKIVDDEQRLKNDLAKKNPELDAYLSEVEKILTDKDSGILSTEIELTGKQINKLIDEGKLEIKSPEQLIKEQSPKTRALFDKIGEDQKILEGLKKQLEKAKFEERATLEKQIADMEKTIFDDVKKWNIEGYYDYLRKSGYSESQIVKIAERVNAEEGYWYGMEKEIVGEPDLSPPKAGKSSQPEPSQKEGGGTAVKEKVETKTKVEMKPKSAEELERELYPERKTEISVKTIAETPVKPSPPPFVITKTATQISMDDIAVLPPETIKEMYGDGFQIIPLGVPFVVTDAGVETQGEVKTWFGVEELVKQIDEIQERIKVSEAIKQKEQTKEEILSKEQALQKVQELQKVGEKAKVADETKLQEVPAPELKEKPITEEELKTKIKPLIPLKLTIKFESDPKKTKKLENGFITWRQGKTYWAIPQLLDGTFNTEDKVASGKPFKGTTKFAQGKGSLYKTIQYVGKNPPDKTFIDVGWLQFFVEKRGNDVIATQATPDETANWEGVNRYSKEKFDAQDKKYQEWRAQYTGNAEASDVEVPASIEPIKKAPLAMHKVEWTPYSKWKGSNIKVFKVDGNYIRTNVDPDWNQGGHSEVYDYVPKNEIWIERMRSPEEEKFTLIHELAEYEKMREKMPYTDAHTTVANVLEREARLNPQRVDYDLEKQLSKFAPEEEPIQRPPVIEERIQVARKTKGKGKILYDPYKSYYLGHEIRQPELVANL